MGISITIVSRPAVASIGDAASSDVCPLLETGPAGRGRRLALQTQSTVQRHFAALSDLWQQEWLGPVVVRLLFFA